MIHHRWTARAALLVAAVSVASAAFAATGRQFKAKLNGAQEVPATVTDARGHASLKLDKRGHKMDIVIEVSKITDVIAAHLHKAPRGQNGGIVASLYGPADPGGREKGRLLCRTITKGDLVGDLAGQPLSTLIEEIDAGNIYVNVHTVANPGGEIRGQVEKRGR